MGFQKRLVAVALVGVTALGMLGVGKSGMPISEKKTLKSQEEELALALHLSQPKDTLYFWYTDEGMTDYLNSVSVSFNEEQKDIRVVPVLKSGSEYIEHISQSSVEQIEMPDLYLIGNDSLEKAYMAGVASEIAPPEDMDFATKYPQKAIDAVTYQGQLYGYPLSYVISSFLYNETYLQEYLEAQEDKNQDYLPKTIDDLLAFADAYDAPEQVDGVLRWDVNDIFYNYSFVGHSCNVGGPCGDQIEEIDLYNESAIRSMQVYKNLNQFFSIDTEQVSYEGVVQDFIDGKIVFTVVKQDAIAQIEAAKAEGKFPYTYGVTRLPDISSEIPAKTLSVTNAIVINGYSEQKEMANAFASYLVNSTKDGTAFLNRTGKVSALLEASYDNPVYQEFMEEYKKSEPIAKMVETGNYWLKLEVAFSKIWDGENVNSTLKQLSEEIMTQVTGEDYQEEYIPVEEEVVEQELLEE